MQVVDADMDMIIPDDKSIDMDNNEQPTGRKAFLPTVGSFSSNSQLFDADIMDMRYDCGGSVRAPVRLVHPNFSLPLGPGTSRNMRVQGSPHTTGHDGNIPSFGIDKSDVPVWAQPSYRADDSQNAFGVGGSPSPFIPYSQGNFDDDYSVANRFTTSGGVNPAVMPSPFGVTNRFGFPTDIVDEMSLGAMDLPYLSPPIRSNTNVYIPWTQLEHIPQGRMLETNEVQDKDWGQGGNTSSNNGANTGSELVDNNSNGNGSAGLASVGSAYHPQECRPCAFYFTKGCINGAECRFCHEWHPPKKKKPMKEQKNLMIIARPDGKIEFMRCTMVEALRVL